MCRYAPGLSHFIRTYNYRNNLVATVSLVNAAVKSGTVKCFVFTSSIAVYGAGQVPFDESTVPVPEDPYGRVGYSYNFFHFLPSGKFCFISHTHTLFTRVLLQSQNTIQSMTPSMVNELTNRE